MAETAFTSDQALDFLREQIQDQVEALQEDIKQQVDKGAFDKAQALVQQAQSLAALVKELDAWAERFHKLVKPDDGGGDPTTKLKKGLKTPQSAYRVPILSTLVALGGEADSDTVIERVHAIMADRFNAYDLAVFADGKTIRWVNTAHWTRNAMREEGLIRDDSPRGTWAISDKGRAWLKAQPGG